MEEPRHVTAFEHKVEWAKIDRKAALVQRKRGHSVLVVSHTSCEQTVRGRIVISRVWFLNNSRCEWKKRKYETKDKTRSMDLLVVVIKVKLDSPWKESPLPAPI